MTRKTKEPSQSLTPFSEDRRKNLQVEEAGGPIKVVFADAMVNVGFGPSVSRFTLGIENPNKTLTPFTTVIMPTHRLIEALAAIQGGLTGNEEMRNALQKGLDQMKMTIDNLAPK